MSQVSSTNATNHITCTKLAVQERVYDDSGYRKRAEGILFRSWPHTKEVMLVSSRKSKGSWTVPGGGLEPSETSSEAVLREAREEAGVEAQIVGVVGGYKDEERKTSTEVFALVVTDELYDWQDRTEFGRSRKWFPTEDAIDHLLRRGSPKAKCLQTACQSNGIMALPQPINSERTTPLA